MELTDKFEIKNHRRYSMLDEAWDKASMGAINRNEYIIEDNIHTKAEEKILDLSEWIDSVDGDDIDITDIDIKWVDADENENVITVNEQYSDVSLLPIFEEGLELVTESAA